MSADADGPLPRKRILEEVRESVDGEEFGDGSWFSFDVPVDWEHVESEWVRAPFAHVSVLRDTDDELHYHVLEPRLDEFERYVRRDLSAVVRSTLVDEDVEDAQFRERVDDLLAENARTVAPETRRKLRYYFARDFQRYGAVDPFMSDPAVEDVSCDGADVPIFVYHADYGNLRSNRSFDADRLDSLAVKLAQQAGRHLSASMPLLTDTLPDGSRIQVTLGGDVAARGSNFTVRKFREEGFTPPELVSLGTFSVEQLAYLWLCIEHNRSILFVGPTASGKTTSMNALSLFIPPDHKIVSIEETREIGLPHDNWIADVTRESDLGEDRPEVGTYHLLDEALHQRPDHILVGEIRTDPDVVVTFFQAIGTGHAGFTTFHADTARDVLRRLGNEPLSLPPEMIHDLDLISVQHILNEDGERTRRCRELAEVRAADGGDDTRLHTTFAYDPRERSFGQSGASQLLRDVAEENGWSDGRLREQLRRRRRFLAHLVDAGTTGYAEATNALFRFARNPERALEGVDEVPDTAEVRVADG